MVMARPPRSRGAQGMRFHIGPRERANRRSTAGADNGLPVGLGVRMFVPFARARAERSDRENGEDELDGCFHGFLFVVFQGKDHASVG